MHQRLALRAKGQQGSTRPHQLVMTATPIPRTLAMLQYSDLDISIIDELPPGRKPIVTSVIPAERRVDVIERIKNWVDKKRQVYWVCTLIEESEVLQCEAAEKTAEFLTGALPDVRVALIHGRMKSADKDTVMRSFKKHLIDLLVATTVIEVGVDVPNAGLMIIENPERLGLSQLHQLRGRVGRGEGESYCLLIYQSPLSDTARQRLGILRDSNDGFIIAEKDLELRGPGEVMGTRQTGAVHFKIADLARDAGLLENIQQIGEQFSTKHPTSYNRFVIVGWAHPRIMQRFSLTAKSFLFNREPLWLENCQGLRHKLPENVQSWTYESGSLTQRLRNYYGDGVAVKILMQSWHTPFLSERRLLKRRRKPVLLDSRGVAPCQRQAVDSGKNRHTCCHH